MAWRHELLQLFFITLVSLAKKKKILRRPFLIFRGEHVGRLRDMICINRPSLEAAAWSAYVNTLTESCILN